MMFRGMLSSLVNCLSRPEHVLKCEVVNRFCLLIWHFAIEIFDQRRLWPLCTTCPLAAWQWSCLRTTVLPTKHQALTAIGLDLQTLAFWEIKGYTPKKLNTFCRGSTATKKQAMMAWLEARAPPPLLQGSNRRAWCRWR